MDRPIFKRTLAILIALLLLTALIPAALASDVDTTATCTLTITSEYYGGRVPGVYYAVYRVADMTAAPALKFTPVAPYTTYPMDLSGLTADQWNSLAVTLAGYVSRDGLTPDQDGTGDDNGVLTLTGLPVGLYLVVGSQGLDADIVYTPSACLVALPGWDSVAGDWTYDVSTAPKYTTYYNGYVYYMRDTVHVLKTWTIAEGDTRELPDSICVHLYMNGNLYDSAVLTEENSWRWTFDDLPYGQTWNVVEDVPEGYTVTVTQDVLSFYIENKTPDDYSESNDTPPIPDEPDEPTPPPEEPDIPDEPVEVPEEEPIYIPKLPQLGLLWWPIPLLISFSLVCFLIALLLRRRATRE